MVARLAELIRLRNQHPAFGGRFTLLDTSNQILALRWDHEEQWAELRVDLSDLSRSLVQVSDGAGRPVDVAVMRFTSR